MMRWLLLTVLLASCDWPTGPDKTVYECVVEFIWPDTVVVVPFDTLKSEAACRAALPK